jgi:hypothetical protein
VEAVALLLILRIRRRRREEAAFARKAAHTRKALLARKAGSSDTMAERKSKRQRFSLGGPAVDISFEDYLTGSKNHVSSDEEEVFDQENQDPEDISVIAKDDEKEELEHDPDMDSPGLEARENGYTMLDGPMKYLEGGVLAEDSEQDDYDEEPEAGPEPEPEPIRSAPAPITGLTKNQERIINKIHIHQNNTKNGTAKDTYYLLHTRLILPEAPVALTRLLRVPAILLFEQLSEAFYNAFDWGGYYSMYTLTLRAPNSVEDELPTEGKQIANIRNFDPKDSSALHSLPRITKPTDLDSRKIRLMDIWHQTQNSEIRSLKVFFTYNCDGIEGDPQHAVITFMGVADKALRAADLGINVDEEQPIWCIGGSGVCEPEYMSEDRRIKWEEETNRHEWDIEFHNDELSTVKVREASYYYI